MQKKNKIQKPAGINRVRINPKTGKTEYKCSFRFTDLDGTIRQSETGWFDTVDGAIKAKKDGIRRKEEESKTQIKLKEASVKGTLQNAYDAFVKDLNEEADSSNYLEQMTGKMSLHRDATTLGRYYIPKDIGAIRINKLTPSDLARSIRKITMWAAYRQLLIDYKEDSLYEFKYSAEEINKAFVFPNFNARDPKNRKGYQHHNNLLRETDKISKTLNLPKYDNQMFRHACAYFLILDQKLDENDVYRYFGHKDSEMLKNIYAKLNIEQNMQKTNQSLKALITNESFADKQISDDHAERLERLKVGEKQKQYISNTRVARIYNQILRAIEKGKNIYYYSAENQPIIDRVKDEYPEILGSIELKVKE